MDGHIDINEVTGPMRDQVARLSVEVADAEKQAEAIEQTCQAEATQILRRGSDDAAPFWKLAANKQAAVRRLQSIIAREEQEAAQASGAATETRHDVPLPNGVVPVDGNGEVSQP